MKEEIRLLEGGLAVDDRGQLQFCNALDLKSVRRFYIVSNHQPQFVRAWHGHQREAKYVFAISGAAIVAAVPVEDWAHPDKNAKVQRFVLSEKKPAMLYIPAGYANGFKTLLPDTRLMFLSTSTLEESMKDDIRFAADTWNPWNIEER
jgi:dTDP-4-dehydrorhamnose 3,5-epimerase